MADSASRVSIVQESRPAGHVRASEVLREVTRPKLSDTTDAKCSHRRTVSKWWWRPRAHPDRVVGLSCCGVLTMTSPYFGKLDPASISTAPLRRINGECRLKSEPHFDGTGLVDGSRMCMKCSPVPPFHTLLGAHLHENHIGYPEGAEFPSG